MEVEAGLTYSGLKKMAKKDFAKEFKKAAIWKKATGVLFLAKYKFTNGKVNLVAIPFKKYSDAAKCYKNEAKKDKIFVQKLSCLATLEKEKDTAGNLRFRVTPVQGGMNLDFLQTYATDLFGRLKVGINVVGGGDMEADDLTEVSEAAGESLSSEEITSTVTEQSRRVARANKIQDQLSAFERAIGRVDTPKLNDNLTILKNALTQLDQAAKADGTVDKEEQAELDALKQRIADTEQLVIDVDTAKTIASNLSAIVEQL